MVEAGLEGGGRQMFVKINIVSLLMKVSVENLNG